MAKQYFYRIYHEDYDISDEVELTHIRKIGTREFNNILIEVFLEILLEERDKIPTVNNEREGEIRDFHVEDLIKYLGENDEHGQSIRERVLENTEWFIDNYLKCHFTSPLDVFDLMVEMLIKDYGFKRLKYDQHIGFGSCLYIVNTKRTKDDNKGYPDRGTILFDRIRKKYWIRLKKKKLRDISEINEEKKEVVRKKIGELKTL